MPTDILPYGKEARSPDRNYSVMLVALAIIYSLSTLVVFYAGQMPYMDAYGKWAMRYSAIICAFVVAMIVATLMFRAKTRSDACLIWTKAINILLLPLFPFGTFVGIYGLWKVDKAVTESINPGHE